MPPTNIVILLASILLIKEATTTLPNDTWQGKWFPNDPTGDATLAPEHTTPSNSISLDGKYRPMMGVSNIECDDAKSRLDIDYDARNMSHHVVHLCLDNSTIYRSNYSVQPVMTEHTIPPAYSALHRCTNESIEYTDRLPTFGTHRPLWPIYGEYSYVPPQRWIHNLEHGAIVMLYHPCANKNQVKKLKELVKKCLYRHVITSSERLESSRPFALVAWGKSVEMSVIDEGVVMGFIRMNALQGPEKVSRDGQYNQALITKSAVITTQDDELLCPNM